MSVNHRDPITGVLTQLAGNGAPTDVGTAAFKDFTDVVRTGDHRLVEANAVANAINQGLSSIYTPRGDIACAELTSSLLIDANIGNVYETSDAGTTSALFVQGADHPIVKGDNVGIIKAGQNTIMFNLMGNAFDLHDYQKQELSTPINISGTSYDSVESAMAGLNAQDARRKNLAYTYVSATALKEVIKEILDNQLPIVTTDTDIYNGTISSTHSGGGDMGGWLGYYVTYVQKNYPYRSHGIVICQDRVFIISCPVIAEGWKVQEVVTDTITQQLISVDSPHSGSVLVQKMGKTVVLNFFSIGTTDAGAKLLADGSLPIPETVGSGASTNRHGFLKQGANTPSFVPILIYVDGAGALRLEGAITHGYGSLTYICK